MRSDYDLIVRQVPLADEVIIYPISDVHMGSIDHNKKAWEQFTDMFTKQQNAYMLLGGDMINNNTRSSVGSPFEDTIRPREQKRLLAEYLRPIKNRIICAVSGNHCRRSGKDADDDPMYDVMCKLDIEDIYRENGAFVKLQIGTRATNDKAMQAYTIYVTHGAGGGIYTGAAVNRNERFGMIIDGLDLLVVGHTHKGAITKPEKIVIDARNNRVSRRSFTVVSSVSWMEFGGYAMQKMLLPSASCDPQIIKLSGKRGIKRVTTVW